MKLTHVTTRVLRTPADNPLVVGLPAPTDTREFVTLELGTDQGLVGLGLTFFGGALTPALKAAVDALARLVVGDDPTQVEAVGAKPRRAPSSSGPGGVFSLAPSAIDIACWDIRGKAVTQSESAHLSGPLARVADALTTPIAAGEYHYGIVPFRHLLEARSIDIVMIDLLRVGGITQWMKVAGMAEAFNLPVVSHLVPEMHVHLVAAIPNGLTVE